MSRRVLIQTREIGKVTLVLVRQEAGTWEPDWEPLRTSALASIIPIIPRETIEHALRGYTRPLILALGLPPEGCLRKLPPEAKLCSQRRTCTLQRATDCSPTAKAMPWCYHPEGLPDKAAEAIALWREGVYLIVTLEEI